MDDLEDGVFGPRTMIESLQDGSWCVRGHENGPVVAFRSDNIVWDFKNLSVREIQPPVQD